MQGCTAGARIRDNLELLYPDSCCMMYPAINSPLLGCAIHEFSTTGSTHQRVLITLQGMLQL